MASTRSGPSTERILRAAFVATLINAFAVWFLWDGYIGYPRENARTLAASLGLGHKALPQIDTKLTPAEAKRRLSELSPGMATTTLVERMGRPDLEHEQAWYYLGPAGHMRVTLEDGRVMQANWSNGRHSETDLTWQRWIGGILLLAGLAAAAHLVRVCSLRVALTPAGLKITGHGVIPFNAIVEVRGSDSGDKHGVVVVYTRDGRRHSVHLDRYRVRHFKAIETTLRQQADVPELPRPSDDEHSG